MTAVLETIADRASMLSQQVKRDIIYFGLGANVAVEDLSHYLKVDQEVVKYILKAYKLKYGSN